MQAAHTEKFGLAPMHSADPVHSAESTRASESPHTTEAAYATEHTHAPAGERAVVKAGSDWRTEMAVIELMEMIEVVKVMKMMKTIDKDQVHARADEKRRPPPPGVGIGIGRDRIPKLATIRVLHELPGPVTLQARTSDDLLHRAIDFRLPGNRAAIRAVIRHRQLVVWLREHRRSKAETDEQCP